MPAPDNLRGAHLHFDCVSGAAGDMTMGALLDLGVPREVITDAVASVGLDASRLRVEKIIKSGIAATNAWVHCQDASSELPALSHDPAHEHSHQHSDAGAHSHDDGHGHYPYAGIRKQIQDAALADEVKGLSLAIFDCLARAEAKLHGTTPDEVVFHEVGAVDSIVDVIGAAAAVCWLAPASVSASAVAMGGGSIRCAHGLLPVPSPAAMEIMREANALVSDGDLDKELCTPTGAAILASLVSSWGSMPAMTPLAVGYGAGDDDLPDRPNVLRVTLGRPHSLRAGTADSVVEIETNLDDMSAELCEFAAETLLEAGALDVWWAAITMKKGRPAWTLHVLCEPPLVEAITDIILRETTSIGLRMQHKQRRRTDRELVEVTTEYGVIHMKIARHLGQIVNAAPEFEDCKVRARQARVPLKRVFAAANAAWLRGHDA